MRFDVRVLLGALLVNCGLMPQLGCGMSEAQNDTAPVDAGLCITPNCQDAGGASTADPETSTPTQKSTPRADAAVSAPAATTHIDVECGTGCAKAVGARGIPDDAAACVGEKLSATALGADASVIGADASAGSGSTRPLGCQVIRRAGARAVECGLAGTGTENSPCGSAEDCAPGFACVGQENAGQCRHYCCAGECADDTYCAERPILEKAGVYASTIAVPVCVKAENCRLDEAYPCSTTGNNTCSCPAGTACTVVKNNLTGCKPPGTGTLGAKCPCAPGFVCSSASQSCLELCSLTASENTCGTLRRCQANPALPNTLGTCTVASGADGQTTLASGTGAYSASKDAGSAAPTISPDASASTD